VLDLVGIFGDADEVGGETGQAPHLGDAKILTLSVSPHFGYAVMTNDAVREECFAREGIDA